MASTLRSMVSGVTRTAIGKTFRPSLLAVNATQVRDFRHWNRLFPHDYELPSESMPSDIKALMYKNPQEMDYYDNYWYWKIRGDTTIHDPEGLPKRSYKQLSRDLGLSMVHEETEHAVGLLELYEYLKSSPFIGPFGTVENPVLVPSVHNERVVGCSGGTGDNEHVTLWFRCREGFLYRCGECDQIFMLCRVNYHTYDAKDPFPVDPDVQDTFDWDLLRKGHEMWNGVNYHYWQIGAFAYHNSMGEYAKGKEILNSGSKEEMKKFIERKFKEIEDSGYQTEGLMYWKGELADPKKAKGPKTPNVINNLEDLQRLEAEYQKELAKKLPPK